MTLLRDDTTEYQRVVVTTARRLSIPEAIVEKDYWITQVLRAANSRLSTVSPTQYESSNLTSQPM
jgi:hypothetical protein